MDTRKHLLATLSALALGAAVPAAYSATPPSSASVEFCAPGQSEEECACDSALKANTIEALEEFIRRYPPGRAGATACTAVALEALAKFTSPEAPNNGNDRDTRPLSQPPGPVSGGPY